MPFKIIQTEERGRPYLCIVPSLWECKGLLWWPPKNKPLSKLIKDGESRPGFDWSKMNCTVKRKHLTTFAQAEEELKAMEENSDTDINELGLLQSSNTYALSSAANHMILEFDAMAENLANQTNVPQATPVSNITAVSAEETTYQVCENDNLNTAMLSNQNIISEKLDMIISMFQNQNKIIDNIAKKIAFMSVQLEELNKIQYERNEQQVTVTSLKDAKDNESFSFTIIENEIQLQLFETTLSDKDECKKLKKSLTFLCSPTIGNGISCAYKLLDTIFSRNFVCACSWSGGSRGDISKVPLKNYKLFQKFFFDMVHSWDESFTKEDCEKFFKNVLKNANKRKTMQNIRASTKRIRKSKKVNEKVQDNENEISLTSEQKQVDEITITQNVSVVNEAGTSNNKKLNDSYIAKEIDSEDNESLL